MNGLDSYAMRLNIESCLNRVALLLGSNKCPNFDRPDEVPHKYQENFLLVEFITNICTECHVNALKLFFNDSEKFSRLMNWSLSKEVSLRFQHKTTSILTKEYEVEVENPTRVEVTGKNMRI